MELVCHIKSPSTAYELLHPKRVRILRLLDQPHTCPELARRLGLTSQKVYYHVKVLERNGLIKKVEERRVRAFVEGVYQAVAESFWLSPKLVRSFSGRAKTADRMSLEFLLGVSEQFQANLARLAADQKKTTSTLGIQTLVRLRSKTERKEFLKDLEAAIEKVAAKYGATIEDSRKGSGKDDFGFIAACYPAKESV